MGSTIDVDDEVFAALQQRAEPLVDTPNDVLRRLLLEDPTRNRRVRVPSSALLKDEAYEVPLLRALDQAGGRLPTREALDAVREALAGQLQPMDFELQANGRPRWQNRAQLVRLRLVKTGDLQSDSPRGTWEITEAGRKRVQSCD